MAAFRLGLLIAARQKSSQSQPVRGACWRHLRCQSAHMNEQQVWGSKKDGVNGRAWVLPMAGRRGNLPGTLRNR